ncbi:hypothetical protein QO010_002328 [Caulobacter ginsengisoli]|uniref:Aspartyl protease n=1 Tax=Caulobacter ginsengisoli TaxID=400775 RepID=A0ABU0IRA7_9CAUL|nr:hypothetical protein [Caulobacter ginsengisoli]MDQ0464547.1 hypothetical protein [Caulobacter ginsengisoli]
MRLSSFCIAVAGWLALSIPAWAGPPEARRLEIPIKAVMLADGDMRFTVPVSVGGGPPFEAMIDTGSRGLRITPAVTLAQASRYAKTGRMVSTRFANGLITRGEIATAEVAVGEAAPATVTIQAIESVSCMVERPRCGVGNATPQEYRIGGMGPTDGFEAVLGLGLRLNSFGNPLSATASGQWIVVLPRPGEPGPGKLIINPTAADKAGFAMMQLEPATSDDQPESTGWLDEELSACLSSETAAGRSWCGEAVLDTGAPNIYLHAADAAPEWRRGEAMKVELGRGEVGLTFRYRMDQGSGAALYRIPLLGSESEKLNLGVLPYYYYAVYYDGRAGVIGLKARPPMPPMATPLAPRPPAVSGPANRPPSRRAAPAPPAPPIVGPPVIVAPPRPARQIDGCVNGVQRDGNACQTKGAN